jgi:hypothetical protein
MKTKFRNITFINIQILTEDKEGKEKENFHAQLRREYCMAPNNDVKIDLGDTNAKIGREREYYAIRGKHTLHKTSTKTVNY